MPKATPDQLEKALRDVARENNAPKVIFPYGFKIVEFNGEKVLQPLTPAEYWQAVESDTGQKAPADGRPTCVYASARCYSQGCPGSCSLHYNGAWYCICSY